MGNTTSAPAVPPSSSAPATSLPTGGSSGSCPHHPINNNNKDEISKSSAPVVVTTTTNAAASCPVIEKNSNSNAAAKADGAATLNWWKSLPFSTTTSKQQQQPQDAAAAAMNKSVGLSLPPSLEEAARHAQARQFPEQRLPLSTKRVISSIPRAADNNTTPTNTTNPATNPDETTTPSSTTATTSATPPSPLPPHQYNTNNPKNHWVYPSEQQFYNAMRRKGWDHVPEDLIPNIVQIHNAVNEQGWRQVCFWESIFLRQSITQTRQQLTLVQLVGRPTTKSIHVYLSYFMFPDRLWFDRHDWYIDRHDGRPPRRYLLDFYEVQQPSPSSSSSSQSSLYAKVYPFAHKNHHIPVMYLHVRPALDSPQAVVDRLHMEFRNTWPGTALWIDENVFHYDRNRNPVLPPPPPPSPTPSPQVGKYPIKPTPKTTESSTAAAAAAAAKSNETSEYDQSTKGKK